MLCCPWSWARSPVSLSDRLAGAARFSPAPRTIYSLPEQDYGIPIVMGGYTIAADVADDTHASLLAVHTRAALLVFDRTSFTASDKPVYVQRRLYRADRMRYRLTLQRTAPGESAIRLFAPIFACRTQS
ncbi:MAG TPA: UTRA domain-containing protein [Chloroflexota bacterium]